MNYIMFNELLRKQNALDRFIIENKRLFNVPYMTRKKVVSLEVELSELANELRFFKYWSDKKPDYEKALTEYVDALHFYLSIANDLFISDNYGAFVEYEEMDVEEIYVLCKSWSINIHRSPEKEMTWKMAFGWFWALGIKLGFTEQQIYDEYLNKNKVNFNRQVSGY